MSRSIGWRPFTTRPPIAISPSVRSSSPAVSRSTVVLPEPEGPTSTTNSPSAISRSTLSTATQPPSKTFVTPLRTTSAIAGDQVAVPEGAALRHPPLALEVDGDDPEAAGVAVLPLEVVEQRPDVVAAHIHALADSELDRADVVAQERDALRVLDHVVPVDRRVVVRGAVLGDHERHVAVVAAQAEQQRGQRRRLDRPAHRRA